MLKTSVPRPFNSLSDTDNAACCTLIVTLVEAVFPACPLPFR